MPLPLLPTRPRRGLRGEHTRIDGVLPHHEGRRRDCATRGALLLPAVCNAAINRGDARPETIAIMVSSVDEEPVTPPAVHINVESKAPWFEIRDDAPRFDGFPPGMVETDDGS